MARHKARWIARIEGKPAPGDRPGRIVIPVRLENDPTRVVEVVMPASSVPSLCRQLEAVQESAKKHQRRKNGEDASEENDKSLRLVAMGA